MKKPNRTVLAVPDLHCPFEHPDALRFLKAVKRKYQIDIVVVLGDELDAAALSDYDHDPDGMSAGAELDAGIKHLQPFYKLFPKALVCTSNHTARPFRKAFKHGLPKALIKDYREFLQAPEGWQWADQWEVDNVVYEHGEGYTGQAGAIKSANANMQSTVIGHIHSFAGIQFSANSKHLIWGFNVGCLIDRHAYAFNYGKKIKAKPILGCGLIINGIPTYIPMILDKRGRWIGDL